MTYNEILSRFTVKKSYRDKAQAICPAHRDKEASLTISKGDKGTVLHCHAGCETEDILKAVGLSLKDLFDDDPIQTGERWRSFVESREQRKIEDIYKYVDLNGNYAFTRIRLSGKKFLYGIMDGERFNYGLNGKSRRSIPAVFCDSLAALKEADRVFYCEGEKDVKSVNSRGLVGVTCGASGDWCEGCAPLFKDKDIVILMDNDAPGEKSAKAIKRDLEKVAKSVRIVIPTPDLEHGDISDFFKDHTVEDLEKLLKKEPKPDESLNLDRFHIIDRNGRITGVFDLAIFEYLKKEHDLFILGGVPYIYRDGVFRPDQTGAELKTMIRKLIYPEYVRSTTLKRIFDLFVSDATLQIVSEDLNLYPVEWINFRNGFYDPVNRKMIPHDPKYRAVNQIPHEYDPEGKLKGTAVKEWLEFICDPEDIEMVSQFSGLCLTRDTRQQKLLILNGEGGTGKSTLIRMIENMIGAENVSNLSLNQLTQRFQAFGLMGKLLNSCADLEIDALSDTSILKKALGEDKFSAEQKGRDQISVRNYAKLLFSTNQLPIVRAEQTNGFYRRLLILTMDRVPETKDPEFFDRLSEDIDDFIRISVTALERMYETGRIAESPKSIEAVKSLRCDSDTVEAFLTAKIVKDHLGRIKKLDLFRSYETFCEDLERQSLTKQNFYRSMKTKGYSEIRSNGTEFFKGILFREKIPNESSQKSLNDWTKIPDDQTPFKKGN